jgi:tetratricopeptide (TPR) repeat protein
LPEGGAAVSDLPPPALAIPGSQPADLSITDVPVGPGGEVNSQGELVRDDAAVANSVSIATVFTKPATDQTPPLLREAFELMAKKISGGALEKVNEMIVSDSKNAEAYALRGSIYAQEKDWGHALQDYQTALQFNAKDVWTRTNVADIEFGLKTYDAARANFAEVTNDEDMGDYAKYMVFLCDLLGGHEDVAQKELDAFNQVGSNASYYFANAGWSLFHQKKDEANDWLASASRIYPPFKLNLYGGGLTSLRAKPEARGEFSPVPAGPVAPGR